jgi:hypothetical protein
VLEEACRGPVLLMLDTLEDAELKHGVDVGAIIKAVFDIRELVAQRAAETGRQPPHIALILSGRHTLEEQHPLTFKTCRQVLLSYATTPFDPRESVKYLTRTRGVPRSDKLAAVVSRAGGNPFKLMLYADVLLTNPEITKEEIERSGRVDLLYLIERVLKRIPDYPLRWMLRYGVVARRLTREFVEHILGPHLRRALAGDQRYDDPAIDDVDDPSWKALWLSEGKLNYDHLWRRLRDYASASSWVSSAPDVPNALLIQPIVTHPMRRVLRKQAVFPLIQRDAVRVLTRRLTAAEPALRNQLLAGVTYHEFQLDSARAARTWEKRLEEYSDDPETLKTLASLVLSEDMLESEAERGEDDRFDLVPPKVAARAMFALAQAADLAAKELVGEERQRFQGEARRHLQQFTDKQEDVGPPVVPLAQEAILRWRLADDPSSEQRAIDQLLAAEKTRLRRLDREQVLLTLEHAFAARDPAGAAERTRKLAKLARQRKDADAYGRTVATLVSYHEARGANAEALRECLTGQELLKRRGWKGARQAQEMLTERQVALEERMGLWSTALRRLTRMSQRDPALRRERDVQRLLRLASRLMNDSPRKARETAMSAAAALDRPPRGKASAATVRQIQLERVRCLMTAAEALRRLMEFGHTIEFYQMAQVQATQAEASEEELRIRLDKARLYLYYVGDLRQAAEHLQAQNPVLRDYPPDLQLQHALLRVALLDAQGKVAQVPRALKDAEALCERLPGPDGSLALALGGLAIGRLSDRVPFLVILRDSLAQYDHPITRLARLQPLRYCPPVQTVPTALRSALNRLTTHSSAEEFAALRIAPPDRVRLGLSQVELLRVLGRPGRACRLLRTLRAIIRKYPQPLRYRDIALACDRLGLAPEDILPSNWLPAFVKEFQHHGTLCGAVFLEQAEREYRKRSYVQARRLASRAQQRLAHAWALQSVFDTRLLSLFVRLARAGQGDDDAAALQVEADRAAEDIGHGLRARTKEIVRKTRPKGWSGRLAESEGFAVRIENASRAKLLSYTSTWSRPNATPHPISPTLRKILRGLELGPISGSSTYPLIDRMMQKESDLGVLLGQALLPGSLRKAIASQVGRAGRPSDSPRPPSGQPRTLEIILECEHALLHAVPWEMLVLDRARPKPVIAEPSISHVWRTIPGVVPRERILWMQRALRDLGHGTVVDGILGPATKRAVAEAQAELGMRADGIPDAFTRIAFRDALRARRPSSQRRRVLLVQARPEEEIFELRGFSSAGTDLAAFYGSHDFELSFVPDPDPELLRKMLLDRPCDILHIASPIAESLEGRELYLKFGSSFSRTRSLTAFTSRWFANALSSLSHRPSMVIVDVPRPPSLHEALLQLVLRNVFAAHLFILGRLPVVLATGLAAPEDQVDLSARMVGDLANHAAPGHVAQRLRKGDGSFARASISDLLGTACVALFARDPDLAPEDLLFRKGP